MWTKGHETTYPEGSEVVMTLAEKFREEGKEEGIMKGVEKGIAIGEVEEKGAWEKGAWYLTY